MFERLEYPRPNLKRDDWFTLNGIWDFDFLENVSLKDALKGIKLSKKINVPFSYQYEASLIGDSSYHEGVIYSKTFKVDKKALKKNSLLCFNAVDYYCEVYLNGLFVCSHTGGFSPFSADISGMLKENNTLIIKCLDDLDTNKPRGKQSWTNERFSCFYTPNTGIWQSVWIEHFEKDYLKEYSLIPNIDNFSISGEIVSAYNKANKAKFIIYYKGEFVKRSCLSLKNKHTKYTINLEEESFVDDHFWTPENPNLYYLDIELYNDKKLLDIVHTRFGMRKISVFEDKILLNNRPYYQKLLLDQGYFKESGLTPTSVDAIRNDIILSKEMGFNGARKHQKFEDPYFYYLADELGFLTWCEMPSSYSYSNEAVTNSTREWTEIVKTAMNYTSVITYVPLNESWGVRRILNDYSQQSFAKSLYHLTKALDPSRLVSINDGWENIEDTDIVSIHDYAFDSSEFKDKYTYDKIDSLYPVGRKLMAMNNKYKGQPVVFSEFGGIAMDKDSKNGAWGYGKSATDDEEFYSRYENLLKGVKELGFAGFCYTQTTDVQQEVNGLLDENHKSKFDIKKIKSLT